MLLPRMLWYRPPRGGNIPKNKLVSRFADFSAGRWDVLIRASEVCVTGRQVLPAQGSDDICELRMMSRGGLRELFRWFRWVNFFSSGRQALEGSDFARQRPDTRNVSGSQQASTSDSRGGRVAQMC